MDNIKRFFECLIPVTACNLKCSYCYVMQRNRREMQMANMKYSPEQIGAALAQERLGGVCYFSICGAGETTLQRELADIVFNILRQGHYVNITTNGTVSKQIEKILNKNQGMLHRLHFSFSFHYLELVRLNFLNVFFDNIKRVRDAGASYIVQINLCDEYLPYLDEIRKLCIEHTGAAPQVAATRKEEPTLRKIELHTNLSRVDYEKAAESFDSPLFRFTMQNFNVKRHEFCYAGDWSGNLDLSTGILRRCYCSYVFQDIFRHPDKPINFVAIGNYCGSPFCMNSSHFMSLGIIPSVVTPTYEELRNRRDANWYSQEMCEALSKKLIENNEPYTHSQKLKTHFIGLVDTGMRVAVQIIRKIIHLFQRKNTNT